MKHAIVVAFMSSTVGVLACCGDTEAAAGTQPGQQAAVETARKVVKSAGATAKAAFRKDGPRIQVLNNLIIVGFDESDGTWDAAWPEGVQVAVQQAGFAVEVDGKTLQPKEVKAETSPFADKLGSGMQIRQAWGEDVKIERVIRLYDGVPAVTISGRIFNAGNKDVTLGTTRMVELSAANEGWWYLGNNDQIPGAVLVDGIANSQCRPWSSVPPDAKDVGYGGAGIMVLAGRSPSAGLAFGYLTAREARPDLSANWRPGSGGISMTAALRFLERKLGPGESIDLDTVYLSAHNSPYVALERYGDAAAAFSETPVRKGANSLWCSWYAHRMAMTEDLVLANAAIAAKHFRPLGMEIMQIDHGWQRGDVTGDWVPNERFPHGLKWLADELKSKYGMKLGVWIAPTDVAETSELFKKHPDWMLKDDQGKPRVNWKWYWVPNPNCYELDASNPAAAKWIEDAFARLSAEGVSYFKIDFIASAAGEHFRQHDPKATRGWSVLRRAMEAIRRGAGDDAWIRYCQTPPLLSAGLANSAYGGSDTLDFTFFTTGILYDLSAVSSPVAGTTINLEDSTGPKADYFENLLGPLDARLRLASAAEHQLPDRPGPHDTETQVLHDREPSEDVCDLELHSDAEASPLVRVKTGEVLTLEVHASRGWLVSPNH